MCNGKRNGAICCGGHCQRYDGPKKARGKVTVVLDSQAGSCGKGKMIGYLALRDKPAVAINNFMSNAGHTFVNDKNEKVITQHLPTSMVCLDTILCIGPGSAITPHILIEEIIKYWDIIGDRKIYIHPRAMVILPQHCEKEKEIVRSGSTFKGCGTAQADKIMRVPGTQLFGEWYESTMSECGYDPNYTTEYVNALSKIAIADTAQIVNNAIDNGMDVIVEGSQGCDLDINYGLEYPHCTSRQCHAGQLVADCGIAPSLVTDVVMIMRPYPIRISNQTNIGIEISSGTYLDSPEITWDEVKRRCGAPADVEFGEMTTVTKKMRRVFEMNWDRLRYVTMLNRPTKIAINFAQYINWDALEVGHSHYLPQDVLEFADRVYKETGVPVRYIGTGAKNSDMVDFEEEE